MASIFNQQHFAIVVGTDDRDQILTWGVQSEVLGREGDDGISGGQRSPARRDTGSSAVPLSSSAKVATTPFFWRAAASRTAGQAMIS